MKLSNSLRLLLPVLLLVSSVATATPVLFERALPTGPNVNADAAGNDTPDVNRSNIKWASTDPAMIYGDDFTLPFDTIIDAITVWMVAENTNTTNPGQELSSLRLFGGNDAVMELKSSSYTFTQATYENSGQSYWNPNRGIFQPIFAVTFSGLDWLVMGGELYDFALEGTSIAGADHRLSLHASNGCEFDPGLNVCDSAAGLSVSRQDGPEGAFLEFEPTGPDQYALRYSWYSHPNLEGLWDKSSDINVQITSIPEPSTFALLGLGFGVVVYFRRRRR